MQKQSNRHGSIFVLDFCILEKDHYVNVVVPKVEAFKFTHMVVKRRGRREDDELELVFRRIRDGENRRGGELLTNQHDHQGR